MDSIYSQNFTISDNCVDRFGRLKPSMILFFAQEVAGKHFDRISMTYEQLAEKGMFWAIIRHRVRIARLPNKGEQIRIETWPMPTTRVAYPRNVVAFDRAGNELFRSMSLWVLMDLHTRAMILPGKSGVQVDGVLRGDELPTPASLPPVMLADSCSRRVCFTDLDINGHMNNCRYLDWAFDLLPSTFHEGHSLQDITLGYLSEAREGDALQLQHEILEDGSLRLEILRPEGEKLHRIFSADMKF